SLFESEFESKSEVLSVPELEPLLVSEPESLSDWLSELLSELEPESLFESEFESKSEVLSVPELEPLLVSEPESLSDWLSE
ncbi:hypothetical protein BU004_14105, partial [Mammaliicoccus sciuri]